MGDLGKALTDIKAMRSQIARSTEFRGFGPMTVALTGLFAVTAAVVQAHLIEDPAVDVRAYLALWIVTAVLSALVMGGEILTRSQRIHSGFAQEMIQTAFEQMLPAIVAGGLLTVVLVRFAPESVWMLPGLWQIVLSLGVFACCRSLPAPLIAVAVWYLGTGLVCLALARGDATLSPWAMGAPFAIGQWMAAVLVHIVGAGDAED